LHRWLQGELEDGSDRGSAIPRSVLRELAVGVRSVAEADAWFDAVGMAWEIDSRDSIWDRPTTRRRSSVTLG
jgi:hypothetical protein